MAILPGLDYLAEKFGYSDAQIKWLAACTYFVILTELLVLGWIIYNIWTILFTQGKYKVEPLLTFFILATMLILIRIFYAILYWKDVIEHWFITLYTITLKFGLGLI